MNTPESSEYLPLQAYHDDHSTIPAVNTFAPVPRRFVPQVTDHELGFLRVVGRNGVPIVRLSDIQFASADWKTDALTRSGLTMQVHGGIWGTQNVALKRIKKRVYDEQDEHSKANAVQDYRQAMLDQSFELQIMSKSSLRNHRNIPKLLAVSFDTAWAYDVDHIGNLVLPILVVEHADNRFPDLSLFLDSQHNPDLPERLPFETAATLIADIADGVAALHNHDLVHADLKPANILIFSDHTTPCGLVAKVADFGFSGMTTYRRDGLRVPSRDPPRGGTTEWNAPECIRGATTATFSPKREQHYELPSRDIYSFGLLSSYIALDGQTPTSYIRNLEEVKLSDGMMEAVNMRLKAHHSQNINDPNSLGNLVTRIIDMTLSLDYDKRVKGLGNIRWLLFGKWV
jgi:serine/threonine protein kinase